mgnify:CR=1 FL=1
MSQAVLEKILEGKIIAIVRGIPSTKIVGLAQALEKGGVNCIEVTFDQTSEEKAKDTLAAIRAIKDALGDKVCVGAGTVMSVEQVHQAVEAGAEYMISPNVNEAVIRETKKLDKVSIPGAMTPTEAAFAYECGADIVKLFPAGLLGGEGPPEAHSGDRGGQCQCGKLRGVPEGRRRGRGRGRKPGQRQAGGRGPL